MRNYLKIFLISISIILLSVGLSFLAEQIVQSSERSSVLPTLIWVAGLSLSTLIGIILPLLLCKTTKSKVLTILLLPTNYVLVVLIFFAYNLCQLVFNILSNLSPLFG